MAFFFLMLGKQKYHCSNGIVVEAFSLCSVPALENTSCAQTLKLIWVSFPPREEGLSHCDVSE